MIDIEDHGVTLGETAVLDGVSLSVDRGEFVGLVGPNGAGKTTLLRTVNGLLAPDAGTVTLDGDPVADLSARETSQRVATVPQETTLAFDFSVRDVVEMGRTPYAGRLRGDPEAATHVERALERTNTARFADRSVSEVSGGERQRVLLARALAQDTPALLLDEPTASLDINHQVAALELVSDLVGEGHGALAAIHDLDLAARFCDRLALLAEGRIVAAGPPETVLTADRVGDAFDTNAAVAAHPVTGSPTVTAHRRRGERDTRVHLVGGGSAAREALVRLDRVGYEVSVGPVPAGDVVAQTAEALDCPVVTAPGFAEPSRDALESARAMATESDAAVLVDPPDRAWVRDLVVSVPAVAVGEDGPDWADATVNGTGAVAAVERVAGQAVPADD